MVQSHGGDEDIEVTDDLATPSKLTTEAGKSLHDRPV